MNNSVIEDERHVADGSRPLGCIHRRAPRDDDEVCVIRERLVRRVDLLKPGPLRQSSGGLELEVDALAVDEDAEVRHLHAHASGAKLLDDSTDVHVNPRIKENADRAYSNTGRGERGLPCVEALIR
ncbi:MAG: hypothetical protein EOO67_00805 [Microbacterium sp.]|nr:MAG: hypothetical protein EOO67_00805 [Microbacterium sp.]